MRNKYYVQYKNNERGVESRFVFMGWEVSNPHRQLNNFRLTLVY